MIRVIDSKPVTEYPTSNEYWFKVKFDRNTDVLRSQLYTDDDIEEAKKQGVKDFLKKLFDMAVDFNN